MSSQENLNNTHNDKIKHLEFIQNTINRMSTSSFAIKTANTTIIVAISALAYKSDYNDYINVIIYLMPALSFWYLDAYYLAQEKKFRDLYNNIREKTSTDFSMDVGTTSTKDIVQIMKSKTLIAFYAILISSIIIMNFHKIFFVVSCYIYHFIARRI